MSTHPRRGVLLSAVSMLAVTLSACSSDGSADGDASSSAPTSASESVESSAAAPATGPFGPGCAAVPAEGPGSFTTMAAAPVITAAAGNPALTTLAQAVTTAVLAESLDAQQNITVLAPANPAFDAVPADALQGLMADSAQLTAVLTHHVLQGRLTPDQLAGTHTTLNNDEVTIDGSGEALTIAGGATFTGAGATVICGNVQTANATVYVIDQVLKPSGP